MAKRDNKKRKKNIADILFRTDWFYAFIIEN